MERRPIEKPDLSEKGAPREGQPQAMDRRLFMQLLVFGGCNDLSHLSSHLSRTGLACVLYEELGDPRGVGLLTLAEDPGVFVTQLRHALAVGPFERLTQKHEMTMFGRTYSMGYEPDLEDALFGRPTRTAMNTAWPWAVWYPLRRSGAFTQLPGERQRDILMEHGVIGRSFGEADLAHDVRLACHGLDKRDNDFVIGLMGKDLHPLSAIVQAMRRTEQTSQYLQSLGPFFIGKACWRSSPEPTTTGARRP